MPLEFQLAQANFRFGLAEGQDPRLVPFGTLTTAENARWTKGGRIEKRFGTVAIPRSIFRGGTLASCTRLIPRSDALGLVDAANLNAYSTTTGTWTVVGAVPQAQMSWTTAVDAARGSASWDIAVSGSYEVITWISGAPFESTAVTDSLWVMARDTTTGAIVVAPQVISTAAGHARVVANGADFYVILGDASNIWAVTVTPSTATVTGTTLLHNDMASGGLFDACMIGSSLLCAYIYTGVAPKPRFHLHTPGGAWTSTTSAGLTGEAAGVFTAISVDGNSADAIHVCYSPTTPTVRYATLNPTTLAVVTGPTTIEASASFAIGVTWMSAGNALYTYTTTVSGQPLSSANSIPCISGTVDATKSRKTTSFEWVSRAFKVGSTWYAVACSETYTSFNGTTVSSIDPLQTVLLEIPVTTRPAVPSAHPHAGVIDPVIGGFTTSARSLPKGATVTSSRVTVLSPYSTGGIQGLATGFNAPLTRMGLRRVYVDAVSSAPDYGRAAMFGGSAYVSVGLLSTWDGVRTLPYLFAHAPSVFSAGQNAGGAQAAGNYIYSVVAEYRDASGVLHRSAPCTPVTVNVGAGNKVTLTLYSECLSNHEFDLAVASAAANNRSVALIPYRSTVGGTILYRMTVEPGTNVAINDPFNQTVTFVDAKSDSDSTGGGQNLALNTKPTLYTTGGVLDDIQPPSFLTTVVHKGRVWGIDGGKRAAWFSKSFQDDPSTAPGFSASFRFVFDVDMVALASLDDKLVFFSADQVWYLIGDGPAITGLNSDYGQPVGIQTDVGCINPRSVVSTPDGVMFLSSRGLYLLSRSLELSWIGRPVQDQLSAYPTITSAVLVAKHNEVRFTCTNAGGTASIVLVYNYVERQWTTSIYSAGASLTYGAPIADACVWLGEWTFAATDGSVYQETSSSRLDAASAWVPLTLETAWVSAPGPLAFQSVRTMQLEGISNSDHNLTVSVAVDGETSYAQTVTFMAGTDPVEVGPLEQCEVTIGPRRKCQHIRFRISDATPGNGLAVGTGMGPSFDTIGIEVGVKKGFAVNPALRKG